MGQVNIGGSSRPGVRAELNPLLLSKLGIGLDQVRGALGAANADVPKGALADDKRTVLIDSNDQLFLAREYASLIVAYGNKAPVRLSDVATVVDSQENIRNAGYVNGKPGVTLDLFRQPQANIIETAERVQADLPFLRASIPPSMQLAVTEDSTRMIRASVKDVEVTLVISVILVILVVFLFHCRSVWATVIPTVVVALYLVGTFGGLYRVGYSIDNLSLMALTISTGFVVDDAIVVIENISRYLEQGLSAPYEAALRGAKEIGFTVLSMTSSLPSCVHSYLADGRHPRPDLPRIRHHPERRRGHLHARLAHDHAGDVRQVPPLREKGRRHNWLARASERGFRGLHDSYASSLRWVLRHQPLVLGITLGTVCLAVYLYIVIPKGFFPQQDTGRLNANARASEDTPFQTMRLKLFDYMNIVRSDPAVRSGVRLHQ